MKRSFNSPSFLFLLSLIAILFAFRLISPSSGYSEEYKKTTSSALSFRTFLELSSLKPPEMPPALPEKGAEKEKTPPPAAGFLTDVAVGIIHLFQYAVSPVDGSRCSLYPTCSAFGAEAFRKYGFPGGILLTADRIIHETDEHFPEKAFFIGEHKYYHDPLQENDRLYRKLFTPHS